MSLLRAILPLSLLALAAPSLAQAAEPDSSPFADRDRFVDVGTGGKVRLRDCQVRVNKTFQAPLPRRARPNNVNRNVTRKYYIFQAHDVEFDAGNKLVCRDGNDDCIISKVSHQATGPYDTTSVNEVANVDKGWVREAVGFGTGTGAHRCTPFTLPGTDDYTWQWKGHNVDSTARVSMSPNSPAAHFRDNGTGSSERYGICRVVANGGTFLGTVREETVNKVHFWNSSQFRFRIRRFAGGHSQDRQVCAVESRGLVRHFHNFQYLTASIAESKWKSPGSNNSLPANAFQAGTLDGEIVYACLKTETQQIGSTTRRYRSAGWWKEGENTCHARNGKGSGSTSTFKILTN